MKKLSVLAALLVLASGLQAYGQVAAESTTSGNYSTVGNAGLNFTVSTPITVTYLGVYDNGSTTLAGPVTVSIYELTQFGNYNLASYTFLAGTYTLSQGNDVFEAITPVTLPVLNYTYNLGYEVAAYFGTPTEPTGLGQTLSTLGGDVAYSYEYSDTNSSNDGLGPSINQVGANTFNAGTFAIGTLAAAPEGGASWVYLLSAGAACFGAMFFFRRNRFANLAAA
jgi:hypothetical protein